MTTTEPSNDIPELFDDLAKHFDDFSGALDSADKPLGEWMDENLPAGKRALDVGCGAGRYTVMLADRYAEVVGADPAPTMIEIAERDRPRDNISYQVRDAFDLTPAKDGEFDVVFAFSCVFHMAPPAVILPHLASLVAPGGRLVIFDPERPRDWGTEGWQANYAFSVARMAYDLTGQVEHAAAGLRLFTHPSWLAITERSTPFNAEEFEAGYSAALPEVSYQHQVFPGFLTAVWERPADGSAR
jgi:2-polyprenyl-3-methyl-5-hydroxy-6-metoxy-1,4-benzoquinol methylase